MNIDYAIQKSIQVNNADYVYLEAGEGDLLVLLHGYPDNAYSWEHQIKHFSQIGFKVVAPFLRGYAPTKTQGKAYFDRATIAKDIIAIIEKLSPDKKAYLVGQDWGAAISYGILGAFPDHIKRAVVLAVPHPVEIKRTLKKSPKHVFRSFHWFLYQVPVLPELIIKLSRGRFLKFLWKLWSPNFNDEQHVIQVLSGMLQGSGTKDSLAYYRAALQKRYRDPDFKVLYNQLDNVIKVPTRVLCGSEDMRGEMLSRQSDLFATESEYNWHIIPNCGHFLHREQAELVNDKIEEWFEVPV